MNKNLMTKSTQSIIFGILSLIPPILTFYLAITLANSDGFGAICTGLLMPQFIFMLLAITSGKEAIAYRQKYSQIGIILAVISIVPLILTTIFFRIINS